MNRLVIVRQIDSYDVASHEESTLTVLSSLTAESFQEKLVQTIKEYSEKYSSFEPEVTKTSNAWSAIGMESDTPEEKAFADAYQKQENFKNENRILEFEGFKFDLQNFIWAIDNDGKVQVKVMELDDWFNLRLELSRGKFDELFEEHLS